MTLIHHELCFGCGRMNLFGLLLEAERTADGQLAGRWFVKQDHQGPDLGRAHPGLVAAALLEAMMLAAGDAWTLQAFQVELADDGGAPVGSFAGVRAAVDEASPDSVSGQAVATVEDRVIARATAAFGRTLADNRAE